MPIPPGAGVTVAVSVTGCPNADGFTEPASVVRRRQQRAILKRFQEEPGKPPRSYRHGDGPTTPPKPPQYALHLQSHIGLLRAVAHSFQNLNQAEGDF
jgi:hypothetical protein